MEESVRQTIADLFPTAVLSIAGGKGDGGLDVRVDFSDSSESWGISCKNYPSGKSVDADAIQAVGSLYADSRFDGRQLKCFLFHVGAKVTPDAKKQAGMKRVTILEWDRAVEWLRMHAKKRN
ncbi:MAG: hypothetical protein EOP04_29215 [Proteobacteria bacterium]|nr:MAG: hypothetical protein EOP04_29215 [Pseudomonadota bacterium]